MVSLMNVGEWLPSTERDPTLSGSQSNRVLIESTNGLSMKSPLKR